VWNSHSSVLRKCDLGFRVLLDPSKDLKFIERPRLFERGAGALLLMALLWTGPVFVWIAAWRTK
jgi:hypothetical protein